MHIREEKLKVYINSDPRQTGSGPASCFVGVDYKAFTPEEKAKANEKGYVKQSAKLVAFQDQAEILMAVPKGTQIEINVDYDGIHYWTNKDGKEEAFAQLILRGLSGEKASAKRGGRTDAVMSIGEDEIPF